MRDTNLKRLKLETFQNKDIFVNYYRFHTDFILLYLLLIIYDSNNINRIINKVLIITNSTSITLINYSYQSLVKA